MRNLEKLKNKPIAILGGGAVAKTCAVDCKLVGSEVRLCDLPPFSNKTLVGIDGGIEIYAKDGKQVNRYGFFRTGRAKMDMVTTDVGEAVKGAGLVVIATPAFGHVPFFEQLIPHLEDGMYIHIFPDNYGSLILRRMMHEVGCKKDVVIGGWASAPYGTRVDMAGGNPLPRVAVEYRTITLRGAALPQKDTDEFFESAKYLGCMDSVFAGDGPVKGNTVMDIGFSNLNPIMHCPPTILGVGAMENWNRIYGFDMRDFSIYSHVFCESIAKVQYEFYREEVRLAEAMGVGIGKFEKNQFFNRKSVIPEIFWGKDFIIPFSETDTGALGTGPTSIHSRYITEDIPVGCKMYHEIGMKYSVKTPVIDSLITLASIMVGKNYFEEGYDFELIGLEGMNFNEVLAYLNSGTLKA